MSKMNIAVFFGSRSCEHDVSIVSALQCMEATKAAGFEVTPVYISRDGLWYTGAPLENIETFREFNPMTKGVHQAGGARLFHRRFPREEPRRAGARARRGGFL